MTGHVRLAATACAAAEAYTTEAPFCAVCAFPQAEMPPIHTVDDDYVSTFHSARNVKVSIQLTDSNEGECPEPAPSRTRSRSPFTIRHRKRVFRKRVFLAIPLYAQVEIL